MKYYCLLIFYTLNAHILLAQEQSDSIVQPLLVEEQYKEPFPIDPLIVIEPQETQRHPLPTIPTGDQPWILDPEEDKWAFEAIEITVPINGSRTIPDKEPDTDGRPRGRGYISMYNFLTAPVTQADGSTIDIKGRLKESVSISSSFEQIEQRRTIIKQGNFKTLTFDEKKAFIQEQLTLVQKHAISNKLTTLFFNPSITYVPNSAPRPFHIPVPCLAQLDMFIFLQGFLYKNTQDTPQITFEYNHYGDLWSRGLGAQSAQDFLTKTTQVSLMFVFSSTTYKFLKEHSSSKLKANLFSGSLLDMTRLQEVVEPLINDHRLQRTTTVKEG